MISSLFLPWYHSTLRDGPDSNNITRTYESRDYFTGYITDNPEVGNHDFQLWANVQKSDFTAKLFSYFQRLDIIGILLVAIFILGMLAAILKGRRELAASLGLATAIFCLFVPLFFMQEFPIATNADAGSGSKALPFWYSEDNPDYEVGVPGNVHHRVTTWSPDTGWYLPIISAFLLFSTSILISIERPRPSWRKCLTPIAAALVIMLLLVPSAMSQYSRPNIPPYGGDGTMSLHVETNNTTDWLITVASGTAHAGSLTLEIIDPSTGAALIHASVSSGNAANANFTWMDSNANKKLDAGDSILLKGTMNGQPNPCIQAGFKVQILYNNNIIATIGVLPSH